MAISLNNSVSNGTGTPAAITGVISNIPAATSVADGTIYISTDTQEIFSAQAGSWVNVSGGGGGSQNLDQVLAVGDTATNKSMILSGSSGSQISLIRPGFSSANMVPQGFSSGLSTGGLLSNVLLYNQPSPNIVRLWLQSFALPQVINTQAELDYQADNNGKNQFFIRKLNGTANDFRRFEVNASYSGGNTVELSESNSSADVFSVKSEADVSIPDAYIRAQFQNLNIPSTQYISVHLDRIETYNSVNSTFINYIYPSFNAAGSIAVSTPEFNGIMANVNERIVAAGIVLSTGNFDCDRYGAYHVKTGSNTNDFDMTNFLNNAVDGQFVTIMAEDTPIRCEPSANILGTATINSTGLFKIMKFQGNLYSSHL